MDKHRDAFGVKPLCKVSQVAQSAYRRNVELLREPHKRCARTHRDEMQMPQFERVWQANSRSMAPTRFGGNWHAEALSWLVAQSSD